MREGPVGATKLTAPVSPATGPDSAGTAVARAPGLLVALAHIKSCAPRVAAAAPASLSTPGA